jgi:hypothetical protein
MAARRRSKRLLGLGLAIVGFALISLAGAAGQGSGGDGDGGGKDKAGEDDHDEQQQEPENVKEMDGPFAIREPNFEYASHFMHESPPSRMLLIVQTTLLIDCRTAKNVHTTSDPHFICPRRMLKRCIRRPQNRRAKRAGVVLQRVGPAAAVDDREYSSILPKAGEEDTSAATPLFLHDSSSVIIAIGKELNRSIASVH